MDTSRIFPLYICWNMWEQSLVDSFGNEWCERCKSLRQSEKNFKESIESMLGIIKPEFTL